jgi:hypothetical protein
VPDEPTAGAADRREDQPPAADKQHICHGYAHGCRCPDCDRRAAIVDEHRRGGREPYTPNGKLIPPPARRREAQHQPGTPLVCGCDRPMPGQEGTCLKCGREPPPEVT